MAETQAAMVGTKKVDHDTTPTETIKGYFEDYYQPRLYNPLTDPEASQQLRHTLDAWRQMFIQPTIVFSSGVFDLFHHNHRTYLLHTKIAAASHHFSNHPETRTLQTHERQWEQLSDAEQKRYTAKLLLGGYLKLVISVDGNQAVAARKGHNPEKGNCNRPVYDWQTRARDALAANVEVLPGKGHQIVDAVTIHDNQEPQLQGTPHAGILEIADYVRPDVWSVFHESQDIIDAVEGECSQTFQDVDVRVLSGRDFYRDELLGGSFTTTAVAQRLGATAIGEIR